MTDLAMVTNRLAAVPSRDSVLDHPSGFLALSSKNTVFEHRNVPGFIAYRAQGKHDVVFGGVHAPPRARAELLGAFIRQSNAARRKVMAIQLRADQVPLFEEHGFRVNTFGKTFGLSLETFSLSGGKRMKLRNKIRRAEKVGVVIHELGKDLPRSPEMFSELRAISDEWLSKKRKKELDLMVGEIGQHTDDRRRVFVAVDAGGRCVGFISYVPVWGSKPGYLHDLTRKVPDAPVGTMELCNARAIDLFRTEGIAHLHFGFTPFLCDGEEPRSSARVVSRIFRLLRDYGSFVYPAKAQAAYKDKWGPDFIEPEFIAAQGVTLRAGFDLLRVTGSL